MASAGAGDIKKRAGGYVQPLSATSPLSSSPGADLVKKIRSGAYTGSFALK